MVQHLPLALLSALHWCLHSIMNNVLNNVGEGLNIVVVDGKKIPPRSDEDFCIFHFLLIASASK